MHHQPGRAGRRSARTEERHPRGDGRRRAPGDQGHRLRAGWLPLEEGRGRLLRALAVRRHRGRRRRRRQQGRGRGRPGHHVRPCGERDRSSDASADLLRASHPEAAVGSAPLRQGEGPRPRRQEPSDAAVRERQAGEGDLRRRHNNRNRCFCENFKSLNPFE